jgi:hypothetical protein
MTSRKRPALLNHLKSPDGFRFNHGATNGGSVFQRVTVSSPTGDLFDEAINHHR